MMRDEATSQVRKLGELWAQNDRKLIKFDEGGAVYSIDGERLAEHQSTRVGLGLEPAPGRCEADG